MDENDELSTGSWLIVELLSPCLAVSGDTGSPVVAISLLYELNCAFVLALTGVTAEPSLSFVGVKTFVEPMRDVEGFAVEEVDKFCLSNSSLH